MKVLFVDACPRSREVSRSYRLGEAFVREVCRLRPDAKVRALRLNDLGLQPLTGEDEAERSRLIDEGRLDDARFDLAHAFAQAELIAVCAPYWDFMFPAALKTFIEHVSVRTLTFVYRNDRPVGLSRADNLVFLTTAGSPMEGDNWGGEYLSAVTRRLLGVKHFHQVTAEGLDTQDADCEGIMAAAIAQAKDLAARIVQMPIL